MIDHRVHALGAIQRNSIGSSNTDMIDHQMRRGTSHEFTHLTSQLCFIKMTDKNHCLDPHRKEMPDNLVAIVGLNDLDQRRVILLPQQTLKLRKFSNNRRRKEILHTNADRGSSLALQMKSIGVGDEAGFLDRALNTLDGLGFETGLAVKHA